MTKEIVLSSGFLQLDEWEHFWLQSRLDPYLDPFVVPNAKDKATRRTFLDHLSEDMRVIAPVKATNDVTIEFVAYRTKDSGRR